jgi:hypothetical protein
VIEMEPEKKRGRPSKYSTPMTSTQRGQESRERAHEAMLMAYENLPTASDKALLGCIERQIELMADPDQKQTARAIAGDLVRELCKRHRITIG